MRRGYCLQDNDKEILIPIMEGVIWRLEAGNIDNIELSVINLGPSQFMYLLECLGYEWDISGSTKNTWHYKKKGHSSLTLYYCGYDGEITLSLREEEDNE